MPKTQNQNQNTNIHTALSHGVSQMINQLIYKSQQNKKIMQNANKEINGKSNEMAASNLLIGTDANYC